MREIKAEQGTVDSSGALKEGESKEPVKPVPREAHKKGATKEKEIVIRDIYVGDDPYDKLPEQVHFRIETAQLVLQTGGSGSTVKTVAKWRWNNVLKIRFDPAPEEDQMDMLWITMQKGVFRAGDDYGFEMDSGGIEATTNLLKAWRWR